MAPMTWPGISKSGWLRAIRPSMRRTSGFVVPKMCRPCRRPSGYRADLLARVGGGLAGCPARTG